MLSYRTNHPNHVHQFAMAVSKNYYAGADGTLKYQKKDMDVPLAKAFSAKRRHMVIYSLRDHCSGVFYSELAFAPEIFGPQSFLHRAWSPKSDYPFQGVPLLMTLPRTVQDVFPDLPNQILELGIGLADVTSGFQSGVRDLRTIESTLRLLINQPIAEASEWLSYTCRSHSKDKSRVPNKSKIELWSQGAPEIRHPNQGWCK